MQRISVNLTNDCDGNQLNYNNDLPEIGNTYYALKKPFETDFLTVIDNVKFRPSFVLCRLAQGSRPHCGPRHPILHCSIFFVKLFATIYYVIVKFIKMYSLNCRIHLLKMKIQFCQF